MASENNLGGSVGLDVTAFKAGVMELTNQMKAIENSFRASAAVMGDWSSSTQGLSSRVSSLQDKLALQRKALDTLNSAYQKTVSEQGAGSKSAQSLAKQMFDMQGKIKGTEGQLKKYQSALQTTQKEEKESTSSSAKLGKAFQDFAKKSKESTSNVKSHFSDLKSSILGAVATIGAGLGFKSAIQGVYNLAESASDLVEAQNVVESTFKTSAKSIEAWTDTTAESAGIGKTAATQWSGFMGAMLKSNGITESTASTMSKSLVQLTGDMSSFYNVGTDEMWEKIRSGISGETEPLKQLGINMSEANLQAYAMSQGIDKSYSSMSQSEKTTLRYNYLLSVTKDAQGDFAKTSNDSMANQSRIFQMNIEDMKQTVGAAFLPMINDMYKSLNPLIKEIAPQLAQKAKDVASAIIAHKDEIAQTIKNTVQSVKNFFTFMNQNGGAIKGIVAGIGTAFVAWKVASTIGAVVKAVKDFEKAQKAATLAQAALNFVMNANPIGLIIIAIGVLVATFAILWNKCGGFRNFWIGLWNGIKSAAQAFGAWFSGPFVQFFQSAGNGIKSFFTGIPAFFAGIWSSIQTAATTAWNAISSAVMAIITPFVAAIQEPFDTLKSGLSGILNGIKSIFTGVWTVIKNVVLGIVLVFIDLITGDFTKLHSDLSGILNNIKNAFSTIWNGIKSVVTGIAKVLVGTLGTIFKGGVSVLQSIGNGLKSFFSGLWNGIKTTAVNTWNGLLSFFGGLPAKFEGFMSGVGNAIIHGFDSAIAFIKNLPSQMLQWGKDMIQGLVDGIKSMVGKVGDAVKEVGNTIRRHLHFSEPDEGPLADYETWMPDFMQGLADGINANKYKVVTAMRNLATDMSISPTVQTAYARAYGGAPQTVTNNTSAPVFYITINAAGADVSKQQDMVALAKVLGNRIALSVKRG